MEDTIYPKQLLTIELSEEEEEEDLDGHYREITGRIQV
jgi:hypothetical protein